jgi:putative transposase
VLANLIAARGAPRQMRSDNGPEFVAYAMQDWLSKEAIETAYIDWRSRATRAAPSQFRIRISTRRFAW